MTTDAKTIEIFVGGDYDQARHICRQFCASTPCCVTVTQTSFCYTGGEEAGVVVGLRSYARFPTSDGDLMDRARSLALELIDGLGQASAMVADEWDHEWVTKNNDVA